MFIVHLEENINHNIQFRMNESGLYYYDPKYEDFVFFKTATCNKESYRKLQIKAAEQPR